MTPADYDAFCDVVLGLAELRGRQLSGPAIELYWRAMQAWSLEDFRRAAEHLLRTCEWMPLPSHFEALRGAGQLTGGEAWELVLSGVALEPGSRAERAARTCGGQRAIRQANLERDLPHVQRRFLEAYAELSDVDLVREKLPQIAAPDYRMALRSPEPLAGVVQRLVQTSDGAGTNRARSPAQLLETPPAKPAIVVSAHDKVARLLAIGLPDDDVAKVSGQAIEFVRDVRAETASEVAA